MIHVKLDTITICIFSFKSAICYATSWVLDADYFFYSQKFLNLDIMGYDDLFSLVQLSSVVFSLLFQVPRISINGLSDPQLQA